MQSKFTPLFIIGLIIMAIGAIVSFSAKRFANRGGLTEMQRAKRIVIFKVVGLLIAVLGFVFVFDFFR